MKQARSPDSRGWSIAALTATAAIIASTIVAAGADGGKADQPKALTGADLYAIHCNRCHAERYPTEWTSAQWKTLMTHMRVRANLPAAQAKKVLKYLQEESGN